jgi:hypothetical protein
MMRNSSSGTSAVFQPCRVQDMQKKQSTCSFTRPTCTCITTCHLSPLASSVLAEVVDELIREAWAEADSTQGRADVFAFDLLVAAVAFSQGKYDVVSQVGGRLGHPGPGKRAHHRVGKQPLRPCRQKRVGTKQSGNA